MIRARYQGKKMLNDPMDELYAMQIGERETYIQRLERIRVLLEGLSQNDDTICAIKDIENTKLYIRRLI